VTLPSIMKAKQQRDCVTPEDLDVRPRLKTLRLCEPAKAAPRNTVMAAVPQLAAAV